MTSLILRKTATALTILRLNQLLVVLAGVRLALFTVLGSKAIAADAPSATPFTLAAAPPMGWNSWNTFGEDINEQVVKGAADKMVELGLKNLG
jgi:hypothetical protein